jgi:hypothetical protein
MPGPLVSEDGDTAKRWLPRNRNSRLRGNKVLQLVDLLPG